MSCRVEGCEKREWMARKFCDRHWKMLPLDLQMKIRGMLSSRRFAKADLSELQPLIDEALVIIGEREKVEHGQATVTLFRTRMASVAGIVAMVRQIPMRELHAMLKESGEKMLATEPEFYERQRAKIEMDLRILGVLIETSDNFGEIIKEFTPAAPAEDTIEIHTSDPLEIVE